MKFTKEQGIAITAFCGNLAIPWEQFHAAVEERLGRPVFTHEFPGLAEEIKEAWREEFIAMIPDREPA